MTGRRANKTTGLRYDETARLRDRETTGPRDCETTRPRDYGTAGLRDCGTAGPRDYETMRRRDHGTTENTGVLSCSQAFSVVLSCAWQCAIERDCLASEWCRCGASQKRVPRDSTKTYSPWYSTFWDVPQMRRYHAKQHQAKKRRPSKDIQRAREYRGLVLVTKRASLR